MQRFFKDKKKIVILNNKFCYISIKYIDPHQVQDDSVIFFTNLTRAVAESHLEHDPLTPIVRLTRVFICK